MIKIILDELKNIKSTRKDLRGFGLTIGVILAILGGIALWRGKNVYPYFLAFGSFFIILGLAAPQVLKIPQKIWMGFAVVMGFFMSRVVLTVLFYAVITPIGILTRMLKKDILDERIDKRAVSYWKAVSTAAKSKESYENQY